MVSLLIVLCNHLHLNFLSSVLSNVSEYLCICRTDKTGKTKGKLTAPLHPELLAAEDVMQQVLHIKRTEAHQTLRSLLSCGRVTCLLDFGFSEFAGMCVRWLLFSYQSSAGCEQALSPSLA